MVVLGNKTFEQEFAAEIKQAEKEVAEMIEAESKKPLTLPTQQEINELREYWLKEKQELTARQEANPDVPVVVNFPDICLGLLDDTEKIIKLAVSLKEGKT